MTDNTKKLANAPTHDTGIYVGPGWIRVRDGLTEQDIVERAEKKRIEWELAVSGLWTWMVPSILLLIAAAWLFSVIRAGLK
jgi:hypothetical protein